MKPTEIVDLRAALHVPDDEFIPAPGGQLATIRGPGDLSNGSVFSIPFQVFDEFAGIAIHDGQVQAVWQRKQILRGRRTDFQTETEFRWMGFVAC